jgi:hypothetical protein
MWITWVRPGPSEKVGSPICRYGVTGQVENLNQSKDATTVRYTDGKCGFSWCTAWAGVIQTVKLTNLPSNTVIDYSCGDANENGGMTKRRSFKSPPSSVTNERNTVTFSAVGDIGSSNHASDMLADLWRHTPTDERLRSGDYQSHDNGGEDAPLDFHLQIGDIAYSGGNQELWDKYALLFEPLASASPVLVSPGNHDGEWIYGNDYTVEGSGGDSGEAYSVRYPGPGPAVEFFSKHTGSMKSTAYWWSINYGPVHITTVSGPHEFGPGSDQYKWIEADLAAADTPAARALQVQIHLLIYPPCPLLIDRFCVYSHGSY